MSESTKKSQINNCILLFKSCGMDIYMYLNSFGNQFIMNESFNHSLFLLNDFKTLTEEDT